MAQSPFLSIIIPVYNTEPYLCACIDSVLKQTFDDYEIILVDDGATDGCPAICDDYAAKNSHIHCVHQSNKGLPAARQAGLRASRGSHIAFVDSDDWIAADMFENMCRIVQETGADIVHCNFIAVTPNGEKKRSVLFKEGYYDKKQLVESVYPRMIYSGTWFTYGAEPSLCNKLFKRSLLEKFLFKVPHKSKLGEDWLATYPCMLEAESVYFTQQAYYYYRSRSGSLTHRAGHDRLDDMHLLFHTCTKVIDINRYPIIAKQRDYYFAYQCLLILPSVFQDKTDAPKPGKNLFLEECAHPLIAQAFRTVKIRDINGWHNKLYAFCIRHRQYLLFRLFLRI